GVREANGGLRSSEAVLLDVAERFAGMEDGAGKTALAMKIFGRAGAELVPFLNQGREGLEQLREEARRLGITFSTDLAKHSENINDNLERLGKTASGAARAIIDPFIPAIDRMIARMAK